VTWYQNVYHLSVATLCPLPHNVGVRAVTVPKNYNRGHVRLQVGHMISESTKLWARHPSFLMSMTDAPSLPPLPGQGRPPVPNLTGVAVSPPCTRGLVLMTDGAAKGNPGPGGSGGVVVDPATGIVVRTFRRFLGQRVTNNEAEYYALLDGARVIKMIGASTVEIRCDSKLLVQQLNRKWAIKAPHLRRIVDEIREELSTLGSWSIRHHRRHFNKLADREANLAVISQVEALRTFVPEKTVFVQLDHEVAPS